MLFPNVKSSICDESCLKSKRRGSWLAYIRVYLLLRYIILSKIMVTTVFGKFTRRKKNEKIPTQYNAIRVGFRRNVKKKKKTPEYYQYVRVRKKAFP